MKSKILLVGGTGYLGRHLQKQLQEMADIYVTGTSKAESKNYYTLDYNNGETFAVIQQKFDIVILLAASLSGLGQTNLNDPGLRVNTISFGGFLQFIVDRGISSRFVFVSSMTVYGLNNHVPVKETGTVRPLSVYGLSKVIAEHQLEFAVRSNSLKAVVLRVPGLFGGDRKAGFIYNTIKLCKGNEDVCLNTANLGYWECMEVNDLSRLFKNFLLAYNWEETFEVFNFGYGQETDFVETALMIRDYCGSSSNVRSVDGKKYARFFLSNEKLRRWIAIDCNFEASLKGFIHTVNQEE